MVTKRVHENVPDNKTLNSGTNKAIGVVEKKKGGNKNVKLGQHEGAQDDVMRQGNAKGDVNTTPSDEDTDRDTVDDVSNDTDASRDNKDSKLTPDMKNKDARHSLKARKESRGGKSNKCSEKQSAADVPAQRSRSKVYLAVTCCLVAVAWAVLSSREPESSGKPESPEPKSRDPQNSGVNHHEGVHVLSRDTGYEKSSITNDADYLIKEALDEADSSYHHGNPAKALSLFKQIIDTHPQSPRGLFGYALANIISAKIFKRIDKEDQASSANKKAVSAMLDAIKCPDVPRDLLLMIIPRLVQTCVSSGSSRQLDAVWQILYRDYTHYPEVRRLYGQELDKHSKTRKHAEMVFRELMDADPTDCLSMAMLGKIYNLRYKDYGKAAGLIQRAVDMDCKGVRKNWIYNHLGQAYSRLGQTDKTNAIYDLGVAQGLFLSRDQRSNHNADVPLTARPWWSYEDTTYEDILQSFERNWETIRDEAMFVLAEKKALFISDIQDDVEEGVRQSLVLYSNGHRNDANCRRTPRTCDLLDAVPAITTLTRGHVKFSVLHPGNHLPAGCGPTNCRLRAQLGLIVPAGPRIRVANETRTWEEGNFILFDDSFEHEVWHDGTSGYLLVLNIDFWHPDLALEQRDKLPPV